MKLPSLKIPGKLSGVFKAPFGLFAKLGGLIPQKLLPAKFRKSDDPDAARAEPTLGPASSHPAGADDDDIPDYLAPTWFQKNGQIIAVGLAYFMFFGALAGTVGYLYIAGDTIEEQMIAARPRAEVPGTDIKLTRIGGEADSGSSDTGSSEAGAEAQSDATQSPAAQSGEGQSADEMLPDAPDRYAGLLAPHPDPALVEESESGPLPRIGTDGRQPWRVYSRPYNSLETRPKIAVVVTDLGINTARTEQALGLPGPVTLAFAPYSQKVVDWIGEARDGGHEVLLTLPMEPADFPRSDPGPFALMTTLESDQNRQRLEWVMSRASGYVGFIGFQGSGFSTNPQALRPVMTNLRDRGLLYLDARQAGSSAAPQVAKSLGMPIGQADIMLDTNVSRAGILKQLKLAESLAKSNGSAIIVGHPYPVTLERLKVWLRQLSENGVALTPLSAIIASRSGT